MIATPPDVRSISPPPPMDRSLALSAQIGATREAAPEAHAVEQLKGLLARLIRDATVRERCFHQDRAATACHPPLTPCVQGGTLPLTSPSDVKGMSRVRERLFRDIRPLPDP